jgi:hypothetical protein
MQQALNLLTRFNRSSIIFSLYYGSYSNTYIILGMNVYEFALFSSVHRIFAICIFFFLFIRNIILVGEYFFYLLIHFVSFQITKLDNMFLQDSLAFIYLKAPHYHCTESWTDFIAWKKLYHCRQLQQGTKINAWATNTYQKQK